MFVRVNSALLLFDVGILKPKSSRIFLDFTLREIERERELFFYFRDFIMTAPPVLSDAPGPSSYMTDLKLTIRHLTAKDYGPYRCVAKYPRGETDGTIKIYRKL